MTTIRKWGRSLAIRIPKPLAQQLKAKPGTPVEIRTQQGSLVVTPEARPKYRLKDLLKRCTPRTLHGKMDFGPDVGREVLA
jgi:antitoxin MazE